MNIHNNGTFVKIGFSGGTTVTHAWDVIEEAYGTHVDDDMLALIVQKVENSSGYPYMTDEERDNEFWTELKRSRLAMLKEKYQERCEQWDAYGHEVDSECQRMESEINHLEEILEELNG